MAKGDEELILCKAQVTVYKMGGRDGGPSIKNSYWPPHTASASTQSSLLVLYARFDSEWA